MKNKNKKSKLIPILSIALSISIGVITYSSIILYNSSKSFHIRKKSKNIKKFINMHIDEWNNLCLLVSNNSNKVTKEMSMNLVNSNSSFIYISYFYSDNEFKKIWNEYINKYKSYNLKNILDELENSLIQSNLIIDSSSKEFSKELSSVIDGVYFNKIYSEWVFWLDLFIEIIMIVLLVILFMSFIKKLKT